MKRLSETPADQASRERLRQAIAYKTSVIAMNGNPELRRIAESAAILVSTPMGVVSILYGDHPWLPTAFGINDEQPAPGKPFCDHTLVAPDGVLCVHDAAADERFAGLANVSGTPFVRFYAGASIRNKQGEPLGAVCVMDTQPRSTVTPQERHGLRSLADAAACEIDRVEHVCRYSAAAIAAIEGLIENAVRRGDDLEMFALDRILQDLENRLASDLR